MNYAAMYFRRRLQRSFLSLLICAGAISGTHAAPQADRKQLVGRARETYYNLRRSGLIEFQSKITPNWELLLVSVDTVYEGKPAQIEWLFTEYQVKVR